MYGCVFVMFVGVYGWIVYAFVCIVVYCMFYSFVCVCVCVSVGVWVWVILGEWVILGDFG
jgi:hypothetical protein